MSCDRYQLLLIYLLLRRSTHWRMASLWSSRYSTWNIVFHGYNCIVQSFQHFMGHQSVSERHLKQIFIVLFVVSASQQHLKETISVTTELSTKITNMLAACGMKLLEIESKNWSILQKKKTFFSQFFVFHFLFFSQKYNNNGFFSCHFIVYSLFHNTASLYPSNANFVHFNFIFEISYSRFNWVHFAPQIGLYLIIGCD